MMLLITTQCYENYGTPETPFWKCKGDSCYKVLNVPSNLTAEQIEDTVRDQVEYCNPYSEEYITGSSFHSDDHLSWFEQSQLDLDGKITSPEPTILWDDIPYLKKIDEMNKVKEFNDG